MHTIEATYPSGRRAQFEIPAEWGELRPSDWSRIATAVATRDVYNFETVRALARYTNALGIPVKLPAWVFDEMPPSGKNEVLKCLDFLMIDHMSTPPFARLRVGGEWVYPPAPRLENISIIEFAFLDMAYVVYCFTRQQGNEKAAAEWLDRMCAYMCRPLDPSKRRSDPDFGGDLREAFNSYHIDPRIPAFARELTPEEKYGILLFYAGCKHSIQARFSRLFPRTLTDPEPADGEEKEEKPTRPEPKRWLDVISRLAGGKFGTLAETRRASAYEIFEELEAQIRFRKETQS